MGSQQQDTSQYTVKTNKESIFALTSPWTIAASHHTWLGRWSPCTEITFRTHCSDHNHPFIETFSLLLFIKY